MADWKSSILILFIALITIFYFVNEKKQNHVFEVDATTLRYHSNWTSSFNKLPSKNYLQSGLTISSLKNLDLSFAHSNFNAD